MFAKAKGEIARMISRCASIPEGKALASLELPRGEHGDIASRIAFDLAKAERKSPVEIAKSIAGKMEKHKWVAEAQAAGPYINFFLSDEFYSGVLEEVLCKKGKYGTGKKKKGKILVEFPAVNPNKPWHIGHLRNALLGDTVSGMLEFSGHEVERMDYIDDLGLQVAQSLWGWESLKHGEGKKFDHMLGEQYVEVSKRFEGDGKTASKVRSMLQRMEEGGNETAEKGRALAEKCALAQYETAFSYGIYHDVLVFESDILQSVFQEGIEKLKHSRAIVLEKSGKNEGCWVVKLGGKFKDMKDADKILIRSDGTATYTGKDVIFHLWKFGKLKSDFKYKSFVKQPSGKTAFATGGKAKKEFGGAAGIVNVIGSEQIYPQEVIREVFSRLGYEKEAEEYRHLAYEHAELPEEKLSGRKGTWAGYTADDLLWEAVGRAEEKIKKEMSAEEKKEVAQKVGVGAVRYSFLKTAPEKRLIFKWEEALSLEGNSGPYLQYAYVRASKILEKGKHKPAAGKGYEFNPEERALIRKIAMLSEVVEKAASDLRPNTLCEYAYSLSEAFSSFYTKHSVLKSEGETRKVRLALTASFAQALGNVLALLGMPLPEMM